MKVARKSCWPLGMAVALTFSLLQVGLSISENTAGVADRPRERRVKISLLEQNQRYNERHRRLADRDDASEVESVEEPLVADKSLEQLFAIQTDQLLDLSTLQRDEVALDTIVELARDLPIDEEELDRWTQQVIKVIGFDLPDEDKLAVKKDSRGRVSPLKRAVNRPTKASKQATLMREVLVTLKRIRRFTEPSSASCRNVKLLYLLKRRKDVGEHWESFVDSSIKSHFDFCLTELTREALRLGSSDIKGITKSIGKLKKPPWHSWISNLFAGTKGDADNEHANQDQCAGCTAAERLVKRHPRLQGLNSAGNVSGANFGIDANPSSSIPIDACRSVIQQSEASLGALAFLAELREGGKKALARVADKNKPIGNIYRARAFCLGLRKAFFANKTRKTTS